MSPSLYRASLLSAAACLLIGCAPTTRPLQVSPPAECLTPVVTQPCTLRPEFVNLDLGTQAAMILACEVANGQIRREWERKHGCLVKAIADQ